MRTIQNNLNLIFFLKTSLLIFGLLLSSCTETRYVDYRDRGRDDDFPLKMVAYEISPSFYENFPDCVLLLPPEPRQGITKELSRIIELALARHIVRRFNRVIDGLERQAAIERHGLDILNPSERRSLAKKLKCDTYIQTQVLNPHIDYLLVWSQVGIGLELQLKETADDHLLWRARHNARRSEGGLSFSPIGILSDTIRSSRFAADREIAEGLVDDALRRMVVPLPNTRTY